MRTPWICLVAFAGLFLGMSITATDVESAATATNQLGVDLHRRLATGEGNLCLSPYSIQSALAMTFAGADGATRAEMARVLHFSGGEEKIHVSFATLQGALEELRKSSGDASEPITIAIANRLFAQTGFDFRENFRQLVRKFYGAPFEQLDFEKNPERERQHINKWVADQTRERIRDLIPPRGVNEATTLVLANAIYVKAPWAEAFSESATKPAPFHVRGGATVDLPMIRKRDRFGYLKANGFTAVTLLYVESDLQFVVLLPEEINGLRQLESKLSAGLLAQCARLERRDVDFSMPKFRFEPPTIALADVLEKLGMKNAFDQPRGSANFDRIAPRKPNDHLYLSNVFHKTFIAVDEKGTEAAAATAAVVMRATAMRETTAPIEVKVDRPFLYAIQHVPSGACLFLGRVTDPR
ncbi:MAG TPA: serpin family protein [Chthoniobacterales bacterium]